MQARRRTGGEAPVTAARRAAAEERAGAGRTVSEERGVGSPERPSLDASIVAPGGRAAGEKAVRAPEGWGTGQEDRPSVGQEGHDGGAASPQHRAGSAAAGAGQSAIAGDGATSGRSPARSPSASILRNRMVRPVGIARGL